MTDDASTTLGSDISYGYWLATALEDVGMRPDRLARLLDLPKEEIDALLRGERPAPDTRAAIAVFFETRDSKVVRRQYTA